MKLTPKQVKALKEYAKIIGNVSLDKDYTEDEIDAIGDASAEAMDLAIVIVRQFRPE